MSPNMCILTILRHVTTLFKRIIEKRKRMGLPFTKFCGLQRMRSRLLLPNVIVTINKRGFISLFKDSRPLSGVPVRVG